MFEIFCFATFESSCILRSENGNGIILCGVYFICFGWSHLFLDGLVLLSVFSSSRVLIPGSRRSEQDCVLSIWTVSDCKNQFNINDRLFWNDKYPRIIYRELLYYNLYTLLFTISCLSLIFFFSFLQLFVY